MALSVLEPFRHRRQAHQSQLTNTSGRVSFSSQLRQLACKSKACELVKPTNVSSMSDACLGATLATVVLRDTLRYNRLHNWTSCQWSRKLLDCEKKSGTQVRTFLCSHPMGENISSLAYEKVISFFCGHLSHSPRAWKKHFFPPQSQMLG